MPVTVCLWDPSVLMCSATVVVVIGGRRFFRFSSSGEGEVSCSGAVRLKCTKKKKYSLHIWHCVNVEHCLFGIMWTKNVKTKSNSCGILLQDAGLRVDHQRLDLLELCSG